MWRYRGRQAFLAFTYFTKWEYIGRQGGMLACKHAGRQVDRLAGWPAGRLACWHASRQAGRQAGRMAGGKAGMLYTFLSDLEGQVMVSHEGGLGWF